MKKKSYVTFWLGLAASYSRTKASKDIFQTADQHCRLAYKEAAAKLLDKMHMSESGFAIDTLALLLTADFELSSEAEDLFELLFPFFTELQFEDRDSFLIKVWTKIATRTNQQNEAFFKNALVYLNTQNYSKTGSMIRCMLEAIEKSPVRKNGIWEHLIKEFALKADEEHIPEIFGELLREQKHFLLFLNSLKGLMEENFKQSRVSCALDVIAVKGSSTPRMITGFEQVGRAAITNLVKGFIKGKWEKASAARSIAFMCELTSSNHRADIIQAWLDVSVMISPTNKGKLIKLSKAIDLLLSGSDSIIVTEENFSVMFPKIEFEGVSV